MAPLQSGPDMQSQGSQAPRLFGTVIAMQILATVAVILRLWSRALSPCPQKLWHDDWLAVIGLVHSPVAFTSKNVLIMSR